VPVLTGLSTSSGPTAGGTSVVISGSSFTGATKVSFGGIPASSWVFNSDSQITATSPAQVAGAVDVTVGTLSGSSAVVVGDQFTYNAALLTVTSLNVNTGPTSGGTVVTITGANFMGATSVLFGLVPAALFSVNGDGSISAASPIEAAGVTDITVVTLKGTSATSSADHFTFTSSSGTTPTVTSLSPNFGPDTGGKAVTITGTNLSGVSQVWFGSSPATSFTVLPANSISAVAPLGAIGTVDVTVSRR
jgi:large repetitive protein